MNLKGDLMKTIDMKIREKVLEELEEEDYILEDAEKYDEWVQNTLIAKTIRITKKMYKL